MGIDNSEPYDSEDGMANAEKVPYFLAQNSDKTYKSVEITEETHNLNISFGDPPDFRRVRMSNRDSPKIHDFSRGRTSERSSTCTMLMNLFLRTKRYVQKG